jgi:Acyclic terpene utilisation family protein AtuA
MSLRIGSGSAWWGDRISPAVLNAEHGDLHYLCFETMAESTVSAAQVRRRRDPAFPGYDTYLEDRLRAVLPHCLRRGTRIVSNQGWIDPIAAAKRARSLLDEHGATDWPVAAITGNVVTERIAELAGPIMETGGELSEIEGEIVSAEAYLGADPIVEALQAGARVVITGRVADPSLFLAPMIHEFGWPAHDARRLGQGAGIGHLMECGAQITGGYFADPGYKDVPEPWNLAFPIAEVEPDGSAVITKVEGTGGAIDRMTVLEQMFYEVHDPASYITPDVVVDFTTADVDEVARDRVRVANLGGRPRTDTLKVSIGAMEGYIGEDMFFYAGPGALERAKLARRILEERFRIVGLDAKELRIDLLGVNAIHGAMSPEPAAPPYEVAVREGRPRGRRHGGLRGRLHRQAGAARGARARGDRDLVDARAARCDRARGPPVLSRSERDR